MHKIFLWKQKKSIDIAFNNEKKIKCDVLNWDMQYSQNNKIIHKGTLITYLKITTSIVEPLCGNAFMSTEPRID